MPIIQIDRSRLKFETGRTPTKIAKFADIIRTNRLYLNGGLMYCWIDNNNNIHNVKSISIGWYEEIPIAAGIRFYPEWANALYTVNTGIFVKPEYRRQGIGTEILKRIKVSKIQFVVGRGIYASVPFYNKYKTKFNLNLTDALIV